MISILIFILFMAFLVLLGFLYDPIMGPIERHSSKIDSKIFCGRKSQHATVKSYRVGVSVKIVLLLV